MNNVPPRIQTLRDGGATPPTSDCFTPRTMDGNDAAFKGVKYGSTIEGPYRNPGQMATRAIWIVTVLLMIAAAVLIFAYR
jgi:hypothetical protein